MKYMRHAGLVGFALIAGALMLWSGSSSARENDSQAVFNTFYVPVSGEAYMLTIRKDRTFELKDPLGVSTIGTVVTSQKDLALLSLECNRYFTYRVESNLDLTVQPTVKDAPDFTNPLGRMPPSGFGSQARLIAIQNYLPGSPTPPVASDGWKLYSDVWLGRQAFSSVGVSEE